MKTIINLLHVIVGWAIVMSSIYAMHHIVSYSFEMLAPSSYWYEYNSVKPSKIVFNKWEEIIMESDVARYRPIDTQRQDTMFCSDWLRQKKYPTQYRPTIGSERTKTWHHISQWTYWYYQDIKEKDCIMCWSVIGTTDLWYKKIYQYCSEKFGVNGNLLIMR